MRTQAGKPLSRGGYLTLHVGIALLLLFLSWFSGAIPDLQVYFLPFQKPLLALGVIFILLAALHPGSSVGRVSAGFCLTTLACVLTLIVAELFFRMLDIDLRREEAAWRKVPPYFRKPMVPTGTVFFRRAGPEEWNGQVIRSFLDRCHLASAPYHDEPVVALRYDQYGFRNEPRWPEWDIAVAGDSFTELGHLSFHQLFTSHHTLGNSSTCES